MVETRMEETSMSFNQHGDVPDGNVLGYLGAGDTNTIIKRNVIYDEHKAEAPKFQPTSNLDSKLAKFRFRLDAFRQEASLNAHRSKTPIDNKYPNFENIGFEIEEEVQPPPQEIKEITPPPTKQQPPKIQRLWNMRAFANATGPSNSPRDLSAQRLKSPEGKEKPPKVAKNKLPSPTKKRPQPENKFAGFRSMQDFVNASPQQILPGPEVAALSKLPRSPKKPISANASSPTIQQPDGSPDNKIAGDGEHNKDTKPNVVKAPPAIQEYRDVFDRKLPTYRSIEEIMRSQLIFQGYGDVLDDKPTEQKATGDPIQTPQPVLQKGDTSSHHLLGFRSVEDIFIDPLTLSPHKKIPKTRPTGPRSPKGASKTSKKFIMPTKSVLDRKRDVYTYKAETNTIESVLKGVRILGETSIGGQIHRPPKDDELYNKFAGSRSNAEIKAEALLEKCHGVSHSVGDCSTSASAVSTPRKIDRTVKLSIMSEAETQSLTDLNNDPNQQFLDAQRVIKQNEELLERNFTNMRNQFSEELKKIEEQMEKLHSELLDKNGNPVIPAIFAKTSPKKKRHSKKERGAKSPKAKIAAGKNVKFSMDQASKEPFNTDKTKLGRKLSSTNKKHEDSPLDNVNEQTEPEKILKSSFKKN